MRLTKDEGYHKMLQKYVSKFNQSFALYILTPAMTSIC